MDWTMKTNLIIANIFVEEIIVNNFILCGYCELDIDCPMLCVGGGGHHVVTVM